MRKWEDKRVPKGDPMKEGEGVLTRHKQREVQATRATQVNDKNSGPRVLKGRKLKGLNLEGIVLGRGRVERKSREKKERS